MRNISTSNAADWLGTTRQRALQLIIEAGRLPAKLFANVYMIRTSDLSLVEDRPPGRPPKAKPTETSKVKSEKAAKKERRQE